MFGSMLDDAAARFDLGDKAGTLLSALLSLITDRARGGFTGFLNRFREVGLSGTADSWVNSGANTPLSYEQLESALGEETLKNISGRVGLEYKKTVSASAFMIPHIVDQLSSEGVVPQDDDLLSRIGGYLTEAEDAEPNAAETFDRMGTAAVAGVASAPPVGRSAEDLTDSTVGDDGEENTMLNWLLPLILLAFLIVIGYMFCGGRSEAVAPTAPTDVNAANR
jgi:uncharacterized protein YidB (DUF937 family)